MLGGGSVANRTQIVCLCEGRKGGSIDEVFINRLIKALSPSWLRPWPGSNALRIVPCGGRTAVIEKMPSELRSSFAAGGKTTLMVWADLDDDRDEAAALKADFWRQAQKTGVNKEEFDSVVFVFAKDRLENWIQFLQTGNTDESTEGPRVKHNKEVATAAKRLADLCRDGGAIDGIPPSLQWSCNNWRELAKRMQ